MIQPSVLFMLPDQPFTFGQSSRSFSSGRCRLSALEVIDRGLRCCGKDPE